MSPSPLQVPAFCVTPCVLPLCAPPPLHHPSSYCVLPLHLISPHLLVPPPDPHPLYVTPSSAPLPSAPRSHPKPSSFNPLPLLIPGLQASWASATAFVNTPSPPADCCLSKMKSLSSASKEVEALQLTGNEAEWLHFLQQGRSAFLGRTSLPGL